MMPVERAVAACALLALAAIAGCAAVLGFDDRTPSFCSQAPHILCEDFDNGGPVLGAGTLTTSDGTIFDAPGVAGRALGVFSPGGHDDANPAEVIRYDFSDARLGTARTVCFRSQVWIDQPPLFPAAASDGGTSPALPWGYSAALLFGVNLDATTGQVPLGLGFGIRSPPVSVGATTTSPFFVGYTSDAGPPFGPLVESVLAVELREVPVGQWFEVTIELTKATRGVVVSVAGARTPIDHPMRLDLWNGMSGGVLLGAHVYPDLGEVHVRFDDVVLDVDVPCP